MIINKSEHERIGLNVLVHRRRRGWTQSELAKRSGLSRSRISDIERGKESFTLASIIDLGNALDIDYKELLK